jgi:hypothetical protein
MGDGTSMMKEGDADLLERGVGDSCSTGQTPVLAPISPPSPKDLPLLPPSAISSCVTQREERRGEGLPNRQGLALDSSNTRTPVASDPSSCEPGMDVSTSPDQSDVLQHKERGERIMYRRCLSGEVVPQSGILQPERPGGSEDSVSFSPVSVAEDVRPATLDAVPEEAQVDDSTQVSGLKGRSMSFDRRLNEAARFAEAVGEMPPRNQSEVQEIIDETESDYDDDSDVEVRMDPLSMPVEEESLANDLHGDPMQETIASIVPPLHRRQKSRPRWPFTSIQTSTHTFLHKLPDGVNTQDYVYKGICSNPPEITKRGISRGNYAQLHRKAWLEVSDKYHRYGKNLRLYYKYWESLGYPTNQFFDWLDSKVEAAGQPLPNLEECPRSVLDSDTVLYISNPDVTAGYALTVDTDDMGRAVVKDVDGDPVKTGSDGWIFVLRDNTLYGAEKVSSITGHSKQRFHHSSFFGGKAVAAAGILITEDDGILTRLYPHSGHYRPGEADMQRMLFHLHDKGVDLRTFKMDTQQILHVARHDPVDQNGGKDDGEKKKKKVQSLHLKPADYVACFLAHKARFIGEGIFDKIHTIRKANVTTVSEALEECDEGGFWAQIRRRFESDDS